MDWRKHIAVDARVSHGQACVAGTRIPVSVVLDSLAAHVAPEELVRSYPSLTLESIDACLRYAADLTREEILAMPD